MSAKVQSVYILDEVQVRHYWPEIERCLDAKPELWNAALTKEEIHRCVSNGAMQLWAVCDKEAINVAFMTQILESPAVRYLQIWWMYGKGLIPALPCLDLAIDDYMREVGCVRLEVVGRKGFERILRPLGFKYEHSTFSRPLKERQRRN